MAAKKKVSIGVLSGNRMLRDYFALMVRQHRDISYKEMSSGKESCDIIFIDSNEASRDNVIRVGDAFPHTKVVLIDFDRARLDIPGWIALGITGFVGSDANWNDVIQTIRTVTAGRRAIPAEIASRLCEQLCEMQGNTATIRMCQELGLTKREEEIVRLIADGLSNKEIAQRLFIAPYTVKSHVHNILYKSHCRRRGDLMSLYWRDVSTLSKAVKAAPTMHVLLDT